MGFINRNYKCSVLRIPAEDDRHSDLENSSVPKIKFLVRAPHFSCLSVAAHLYCILIDASSNFAVYSSFESVLFESFYLMEFVK